jgi:lycopene beta-cyclase
LNKTAFDFAIAGTGAAGLHLAMAMAGDSYFANKSILLLDKAPKTENDKTWCFWEKGEGQWDDICTRIWERGDFYGENSHVDLQMGGYRYKMVRAIDFYQNAQRILSKHPNIVFEYADVNDITSGSSNIIHTSKGNYSAQTVFDSRIDPKFFNKEDNYIRLVQHFKGWLIEAPPNTFDKDRFVMMDYRIRWKDSSSFTYVLPIDDRKALVEFTLFNEELLEDDDYDVILEKYCREILNLKEYNILEIEKGQIPMSDYPFHKDNISPSVVKIGTAGSWVKSSSGYSFKNAERLSLKIVQNIKRGHDLNFGVISKKFRWYDKIFLGVLKGNNAMGEELFSSMYEKNKANQIFKFLDEETSFLDEIKITGSFRWGPFLREVMK